MKSVSDSTLKLPPRINGLTMSKSTKFSYCSLSKSNEKVVRGLNSMLSASKSRQNSFSDHKQPKFLYEHKSTLV